MFIRDREGLAEMMAADGPIVDCVRLTVAGKAEQVKVDMNPKANSLEKLLGGSVTFVGMYSEGELILMRATNGKGLNKTVLPRPFQDEEVKGDMFVVRMDAASEPENITLKEWNAFVKEVAERPVEDEDEEEEDEDDEELADEDDEEEDEEDEEGEMELGSDEEEGLEGIETILRAQLASQFRAANDDTDPTEEELDEMMAQMKETGLFDQAAARIATLLGGLEEQEEEDDEEDEEEEEEVRPPKKSRRGKK
eukprot:TRINITY_DN4133_c0_g1_i3.p1 TRINITY_DN4133_c0_g1~~TRINITY_DN4133_c0_g1_i3.p1  ORF type:complete len:252 (+),score=91.14 TRINITY_DN4133_c0_g1_i3:51-806(+)